MKQNYTCLILNKNGKNTDYKQKDQVKELVDRKKSTKVQLNKKKNNRQKRQFKIQNKKNNDEDNLTFKDAVTKFKKLFQNKQLDSNDYPLTSKRKYTNDNESKSQSKSKSKKYTLQIFQDNQKSIHKIKPKTKIVKDLTKKNNKIKNKNQLNTHYISKPKSTQKLANNLQLNKNNKKFFKPLKSKNRSQTNKTQMKTQRNIDQIYAKSRKKTQTQLNADKAQSIIVYDFSPQKDYFFISRYHKNNESNINTINNYFSTFLQTIKYQYLNKEKNLNKNSSFNLNSQSSLEVQPKKIEKFFRNEQIKWLKLKQKLQKIRDGVYQQDIQSIIRQVQKNHQELKKIEVTDLSLQKIVKKQPIEQINKNEGQNIGKSQNCNIQKQSKQIKQSPQFIRTPIKKLNYDEAPLQVKLSLKRKSKQQLIKQSQIISKQLSQKDIFFDIQLPNCLNSKISHIKNQNPLITSISPRNSISINYSYKYNQKQKLNKQQNNSIYYSFHKQQKNKHSQIQPIPIMEQNHTRNQIKFQQQNAKNFISKIQNYNQKQDIFLQNNHIQQKINKYQVFKQKNFQQQNQKNPCQNISQQVFVQKQQKVINQPQQSPILVNNQTIFHQQNFISQIQFHILDSLTNQMIYELNQKQKNKIFEYYNQVNIQIQNQWNGFLRVSVDQNKLNILSIQSDINYALKLSEQILNFMINNPQNFQQFKRKILTPLGLRSKQLLKEMRKIRFNEQFQSQWFQQLESQEHNTYQHIISLEKIYQFQNTQHQLNQNEEYNKIVHFQQIYNQSIFDAINYFLDQLRPYGEKGLPPICFISSFKLPQIKTIKNHIFYQIIKTFSIKMGFLHLQDPQQTKQIIITSLDKFLKQTSKEFERNWFELQQNRFDICFDLMNVIQEQIINQQVMQIQAFIPSYY